HRVGAFVVKLDEFVVVIFGNGTVHQFVDDNVVDDNRAIGGARSRGRQRIELRVSIGESPEGNVARLGLIFDGIDDASAVGIDQQNGFPLRIERKAELHFSKVNKTAGGNSGTVRNPELVRGGI